MKEVIPAAFDPKTYACPTCGEVCKRLNAYTRTLKDISLSGPVSIQVRVGNYRCGTCEKPFKPVVPQAPKGKQYTANVIQKAMSMAKDDNVSYPLISRNLDRDFSVRPSTVTTWLWFKKFVNDTPGLVFPRKKIVQRVHRVRWCVWCGGQLNSNRWKYCGESCSNLFNRRIGAPLLDASVSLTERIHRPDTDELSKLAFSIAESFSRMKVSEYIGPVWEGVREAYDLGIRTKEELTHYAKCSLKKHWKSERDFAVGSIDEMKEQTGFQPVA